MKNGEPVVLLVCRGCGNRVTVPELLFLTIPVVLIRTFFWRRRHRRCRGPA
jgi:hypothetical protein